VDEIKRKTNPNGLVVLTEMNQVEKASDLGIAFTFFPSQKPACMFSRSAATQKAKQKSKALTCNDCLTIMLQISAMCPEQIAQRQRPHLSSVS
jgi:hypothetical protein